jgi:polyisoprenoid-binding protein YceI
MKYFLIIAALLLCSFPAFSQQQAGLTFDTSVKNPAYTTTHPRVLIDEAHFNFHTASGRYKPFADLLTNDGYVVATTSINRHDFGVSWNETIDRGGLVVGNTVEITIDAEAILEDE